MADKIFDAEKLIDFKLKELVFRVDGAETGDFISYDESKCSGCGECAMVCSSNLWVVHEGKKARLSLKYKELCLECAACYAVCSDNAIEFRYPNGGSGIIIKHG